MGPGTVIGAGITAGDVTASTTSATLAAGILAGGNGGDGFCAGRRPADVRKETASAAANRPPRRRRVWLPAIGLLSEYGVSSIPAIHRGCPCVGQSPASIAAGSERAGESLELFDRRLGPTWPKLASVTGFRLC